MRFLVTCSPQEDLGGRLITKVRDGREMDDMCLPGGGAFRCLRPGGHQSGYCSIKVAMWDGSKLVVRGCNIDRMKAAATGRPLMFNTGYASFPLPHPISPAESNAHRAAPQEPRACAFFLAPR